MLWSFRMGPFRVACITVHLRASSWLGSRQRAIEFYPFFPSIYLSVYPSTYLSFFQSLLYIYIYINYIHFFLNFFCFYFFFFLSFLSWFLCVCVVGRIFSLHPFFFSGFGYNRLARTHTQTKIGVSYLPYKDATSRRYVQKISLYLNIIYISIYI